MKNRTLTLAALLLLCVNILVAQSPERFNYQAVVRDASNNPYTSQDVGIRFTILNSELVSVYTETQSLTTNGIGLVNTVIGDGNPTAFDALEWGSDEFSLKIELDLGDNGSWETSETKSLNSVPYALHAETAGRVMGDSIWKKTGSDIYYNNGNVGLGTNNAVSTLHIKAPAISGTEELFTAEVADDPKSYFRIVNGTMNEDKFMPAIVGMNGADHRQGLFILAKTTESNDIVTSQPLMSFNVRRDDNTPIENRRIFQWGNLDQMKMTMLANGKLGIGTTTPSSKLHVEGDGDWADEDPLFQVKNSDGVPVFAVYNNGVRILVEDDLDAKGRPRGGFSVGGFDRANKGYNQTYDFMRISPDSIRFNINNTAGTKGPRGGFAVGGFDRANKGPINEDFMYLTPQSSNNGIYNTFVGYKSGDNATGQDNVFMGYLAGASTSTGSNNVFIGKSAGASSNGSYNVFMGETAGMWESGQHNVYIGHAAGSKVPSDPRFPYASVSYNTAVGYNAGLRNTGQGLVAMGWSAGQSNRGGLNTFIGAESGMFNTTGVNNTFVGCEAGWKTTTGSTNVFIGTCAGRDNTTGQNNVFIGNYAGAEENVSDRLFIDNNETNLPLIFGAFDINLVRIHGNLQYTGTISHYSDISMKKDIEILAGTLDKIKEIRGVSFRWNDENQTKLGMSNELQIGVIAQEVEKVYPELIMLDEFGNKLVDYTKLTPVLLEAVKEQQSTIEILSNEVEELKQMVSVLMSKEE